MPVAKKIIEAAKNSSWVRQMFEEGARMAAEHGKDKVFDFSIGNPNLEPPEGFCEIMEELLHDPTPGMHGYMPNAGYWEVRQAIAAFLTEDQGVPFEGRHVVMTVGAGGSLNVAFKTILDPDDEVICPRPYFMEYEAYVDNHGGLLRPVPTKPDFQMDLEAIEAAICTRTRAVLINSPNNPTGRVYPAEDIAALGRLLERKSAEIGRIIYLISDEPYRQIVYDGVHVPAVMQTYTNTIIASSYSKALSVAGERIGYVAANPAMPDINIVMEGLVLANRILGYVNAPALMQRLVARLQGRCVDVTPYRRNRDVLVEGLTAAGFSVVKPEGAFYLFPKCPIEDDVAFCREMLQHLVLVVPGRGFGLGGYFRMAYCVAPEVVDGALPAFREVGRKYFG
jgi:aspartate aminotransferase